MGNRIQKPLLVLSLSLNAAFVAMWLMHAFAGSVAVNGESHDAMENAAVSSSVHREIGVTTDQWELIEPHIARFRREAQEQRQAIGALRSRLIELLAADEVNEAAIRAAQEEILAGQRGMQDLVIGLLLKEKEILTSEQQRALLRVIHHQCKCGEQAGSSCVKVGRMLLDDSLPPRYEGP